MLTALISVWDKTGIVEFTQELIKLGWVIVSSGGTAKVLKEAKVDVMDVSALTGRPPVLGHRVVTLDAKIHGGLMATPEQQDELNKLGWRRFDLVCVDLYPLQAEIDREGATRESVIEKTDIGGPTLLRSAAKGRRIVIADRADRERVLDWLKAGKPDEESFIAELVAKAEGVVAGYCLASARYQSDSRIDGMVGTQYTPCKYGENAWQKPSGFFECPDDDQLSLARFVQVEGTDPSFINFCDLDRMLQTITHIAAVRDINRLPISKIAVGVKHGNPCGAAVGKDGAMVVQQMLMGDPLAIFGGFVMMNFPLDEETATVLRTWNMPGDQKRLLDGVVAPEITTGAINAMLRKGGKCRMLVNPGLGKLHHGSLDRAKRIRQVRGGFLIQPNYTYVLDMGDHRLQMYGSGVVFSEDALLAWAIGSTSNSNTITLVKNGMLIGNGVGQQDRVGAAKLAIDKAKRAGHEVRDAVAYSDSFFPFPDGPEVLADAGVTAILTSSGSVNDQAIRDVCCRRGVSLLMIPDSVGRGFFGH